MMTSLASPATPRSLALALLAFGLPFLAGALGQWATSHSLAPWYAGLAKPSFNPPNWVFGPVWTALYLLMGYALWRVLRTPVSRARSLAIALFFVQLALNALWSFAFFGWQSPASGLLVIVALDAAVISTIWAFAKVDRSAAKLLAPYLAWIAFATLLNAAIWRLNG